MNTSSNKYVIITGANKGIGLQIVKDLLKQDTLKVIFTSRDVKRGQEAIKSIESSQNVSGRLFYEQLDIESEKSIDSFIEIIQKKYKSVYTLINNAAVNYEEFSKLEDFDTTKIDENQTKSTLNINVRGTISLSEKILPFLEEKGRIIFVSSLAGHSKFQGEEAKKLHFNSNLTDKDFHKHLNEFEAKAIKYEQKTLGYFNSIYFDSKFFLNTYVREIIKNHLKKGQTAFSVHPGMIKTDMGRVEGGAPVEEGTVSTLKVFSYSDKEAEENNLKFFDEKGNVVDY